RTAAPVGGCPEQRSADTPQQIGHGRERHATYRNETRMPVAECSWSRGVVMDGLKRLGRSEKTGQRESEPETRGNDLKAECNTRGYIHARHCTVSYQHGSGDGRTGQQAQPATGVAIQATVIRQPLCALL